MHSVSRLILISLRLASLNSEPLSSWLLPVPLTTAECSLSNDTRGLLSCCQGVDDVIDLVRLFFSPLGNIYLYTMDRNLKLWNLFTKDDVPSTSDRHVGWMRLD